MKKKLLIILIIVLGVIGCTTNKLGRMYLANRAKSELIGKTKAEILECAGAPHHKEQTEDIEVFVYRSGGDTDVHVLSTGSAIAKQRYCEITVVFRDGIVERVNYSGRTGGLLTQGEQCAFVLENCLSQ